MVVKEYRDFSQITLAVGEHGFSTRGIPEINGYTFLGYADASTDNVDIVLQSTQVSRDNNMLYIGMKNVSSTQKNNQKASAHLIFIKNDLVSII